MNSLGNLDSIAQEIQNPSQKLTDDLQSWDLFSGSGETRYSNKDTGRGICFEVEDNPFCSTKALDPRLVRIAPGCKNELHRHAHESLFVVLDGEAEILIGDKSIFLKSSQAIFVPRWIKHQSRNTSLCDWLFILAVTDFGLTSAVLGNYDSKTREVRRESST